MALHYPIDSSIQPLVNIQSSMIPDTLEQG